MNVNLQEIINKLQTAKGELQKQQRFAQFATGLDKLISHTSEPLMLVVMGSFSTGKSSAGRRNCGCGGKADDGCCNEVLLWSAG